MKALFIILTGLLVLVNAFFVIAEYALVRSRRPRLEALAEEGARGARLALTQVDNIGDYIAACQVGITMASIGIGALGEPAIAHLFEPILGGPIGHTAAVAVSVVISYLLITIALSIVGEIVPKLYTIQHAEGLARRIARPMQFFRVLFSPFILVLNSASESILRMLGTDPDAEPEGGTPDELKRLIAQSSTGGQLDVGEASMLTGVFHLHEQEARQVMTPIPAVVTVDVSETVEAALQALRLDRPLPPGRDRGREPGPRQGDRPRQPAGQEDAQRRDGRRTSTALVRAAPIVPETKPLDDLLADLQRERTELAIVDRRVRPDGRASSRSRTSSRRSSARSPTRPIRPAGRCAGWPTATGSSAGTSRWPDLEDYGLELPVDTDAYNSVGGFVFAELGRLPKRGDTISANGFSIRVESVRQNRIEAVRIRQRRAVA